MRYCDTPKIIMPGLLAAGLSTLMGCSSISRPAFEATNAVATRTTSAGVELVFTINASNANSVSIPLRSVKYDLRLDGRRVFSGIRSPEATIPPFGSQSFTIPAVIPAESLSPEQTSAEYQIIGSVSYQDSGRFNEILFDRNLRVPRAPLSVRGTITFDTAAPAGEPVTSAEADLDQADSP